MISTTCQRRHDARIVSSTSATGARYPSSFRSGRSHTRITSKCGSGETVPTRRAVVSSENEPSRAITTSARSGTPLPVDSPFDTSAGRNCPSVSVADWHKRARRNVDSRVFGGNKACRASRCRKSSSAGLASSQQCAQSAATAAETARQCSSGRR